MCSIIWLVFYANFWSWLSLIIKLHLPFQLCQFKIKTKYFIILFVEFVLIKKH